MRQRRERAPAGYGPAMARDKTGVQGVVLMVAALIVVLVVFWFVLQYATG